MQWPAHVRFFLENHEDIAGLKELDRRAREDFPARLCRLLIDAVVDDFEKSNWSSFSNMRNYHDKKEIQWWSDSFYYAEVDRGPYFGAEGFSSDALFDLEMEAEPPYLYLYYECGNLPKKKYAPDIQRLRKIIDAIKLPGLKKGPYDGDELMLARLTVGDIINIDLLAEPERAARAFVDRARLFTETIAPKIAQGV